MIDEAIGEHQAAVRQGWLDLCASRQPLDPIDLVDASGYLAALVEGSLTFVHADPARPLFVPWTTPDRRWADNGRDSAYWYAPVDGRRRYRLHGVRGEECYLSFTVYAGSPGHPERAAFDVNHLGLGAGPGEPYAVDVATPEDACYVIARQYVHDPAATRPATVAIEVLDGSPADPFDEAALADRWRTAAGFVRAMTRPPMATGRPSYASTVVNVVGDPAGWRAEEGGGRGTPDQTYALGRFDLGPDEALVMDLRPPPCTYASVVVWNRFSQSVDARRHRSTVNDREWPVGPDGSTRVVLAHRDPGVPGWLDTGGHRRGSVFWRFLLAEEEPSPIRSRVVPMDEVAGLGT